MGALGWVALGIVTGVALAPWIPCGVGSCVAWVVFWAMVAAAGRARPPWLVAGVGLGLASIVALPPGPDLTGPVALRGVVGGAPSGRSAPIVVSAAAAPGEGWHPAEGRVRARFPDAPPAPGTPIVLRGAAGPVTPGVPGAPDPVRAAARERATSEVRVATWEVLGGRPPPLRDPYARATHGGALRALVTGDRSRLSPATMDTMRRSGTAHVIAISGAHIAVVALTGVWLARVLSRLVALARPEGLPEAPAWAVGAALAVAYAGFVGAPASAWRAAAGMVLVATARASGREIHPLRLLATVAAAHVLVDPGAVATASFQLSYGAVLGMVQVTPRLLALVPPDRGRAVTFLASSAATTLGATVGTLPAMAWWFQEVAPLTLVANLVALPLVTWLVAPGAAVGWLAPEPVAGMGVAAADLGLEVVLRALRALCARPWVVAVGPGGALLLLVPLAVPRLSWQGPTLAAALWLVAPDPPERAVLPTPGALVALVGHPDGRRWLVDGGPPGRSTLGWVRRQGVRRLDLALCTGRERARCDGLVAVVGAMEVGQVWVPRGAPLSALRTAAATRGVPVVDVPPEVLEAARPP